MGNGKRITHFLKRYGYLFFGISIEIISIIVNVFFTRKVHKLCLILSLLPLMVALIRLFNEKVHKKVYKDYIAYYVAYFFVYSWWMFFCIWAFDVGQWIENIQWYDRCMSRYKDDEVMAIFPQPLPEGAEHFQFVDAPGYYKPMYSALSYHTTPEEIAYYIETYKDQAVYYGSYRETLEGGKFVEYKPPNYARLMVDGDYNEYELILLDFNNDGDWKDRLQRGIILSRTQNEIVFYVLAH